jgi:drug/metabolite transporter (DMT)-like permease
LSLAGFALVLAAAFCHAGWNFFYKRIGGGLELIWLFSAVSAILYAPLAIYVLATADAALSPLQWMFIAGSTLLHLSYFAVLQRGYRAGDLSVVYPTARASGPLLTTICAVILFGETVSVQAASGIALIIGGVLMLSGLFSRRCDAQASTAPSIIYGLLVGLLIAAYTLWDSHAVAVLLIPPLLLDYVPSLVRTGVLAPLAFKRKAAVAALWAEHRSGVVAIAVLAPLAYILVLYALTFTPVIYVAPTRELSVLLTVLLGTLVLHEPDAKRRLVWACVMVAGVVLLATG